MNLKYKNRLKIQALSKQVFGTSGKWRKLIERGIYMQVAYNGKLVKRRFPITLRTVYQAMKQTLAQKGPDWIRPSSSSQSSDSSRQSTPPRKVRRQLARQLARTTSKQALTETSTHS